MNGRAIRSKSWFTAMMIGVCVGTAASGMTVIAVAIALG